MSLDDHDRQLIETIIERAVAHALDQAAMRLEAVRVNSLMAENVALKVQVQAMEQRLQQLEAYLAEKNA